MQPRRFASPFRTASRAAFSAARIFAAAGFVAAVLFLTSCGGFIEEALDLTASKKAPTAETTLVDSAMLATALTSAIEAGKDKITLNITAPEDELKNLGADLDPFWGAPVSYLVKEEWSDIRLTETGPAIDVRSVEFALAQSVSYYVYHDYARRASDGALPPAGGPGEPDRADGATAPETGADAPNPGTGPPDDIADDVAAVSAALPGVIAEIGDALADTEGSDYDTALAVHDWLVNHIDYNAGMDETDKNNGVVGALIGRSTMCQGYAESFELIMRCIADVDVRIEVGEGKSEENASWVNHAWNLVNLDGVWYQVDATFDDPVSNDQKQPSHLYFGRNDEGMSADHRWRAEYWPAAAEEDFLYYRAEGLYIGSKKKLRSTVKNLLKDKPAEIELAVHGVDLKESDLQFIYDASSAVSGIMYSYTKLDAVTIVSLRLEYYSERT
jgi:hypothetical protein